MFQSAPASEHLSLFPLPGILSPHVTTRLILALYFCSKVTFLVRPSINDIFKNGPPTKISILIFLHSTYFHMKHPMSYLLRCLLSICAYWNISQPHNGNDFHLFCSQDWSQICSTVDAQWIFIDYMKTEQAELQDERYIIYLSTQLAL